MAWLALIGFPDMTIQRISKTRDISQKLSGICLQDMDNPSLQPSDMLLNKHPNNTKTEFILWLDFLFQYIFLVAILPFEMLSSNNYCKVRKYCVQ